MVNLDTLKAFHHQDMVKIANSFFSSTKISPITIPLPSSVKCLWVDLFQNFVIESFAYEYIFPSYSLSLVVI